MLSSLKITVNKVTEVWTTLKQISKAITRKQLKSLIGLFPCASVRTEFTKKKPKKNSKVTLSHLEY